MVLTLRILKWRALLGLGPSKWQCLVLLWMFGRLHWPTVSGNVCWRDLCTRNLTRELGSCYQDIHKRNLWKQPNRPKENWRHATLSLRCRGLQSQSLDAAHRPMLQAGLGDPLRGTCCWHALCLYLEALTRTPRLGLETSQHTTCSRLEQLSVRARLWGVLTQRLKVLFVYGL